MQIGFDAKRAFCNQSGLGNYSRGTIDLLTKYYANHQYTLYTPRINNDIVFTPEEKNTRIILPQKSIHKRLKSYWRSYALPQQLGKDKIDIFHGLSHELPFGIHKTNVKTVITVHDLIFLRYPKLYSWIDRYIYTKKIKYGCKIADKIIAISQQTKEDISNYLDIDPNKIEVVYQGCNASFHRTYSKEEKENIKEKFQLPEKYILYVGTIEARKNILSLIKAVHQGQIDIPIVAIGKKTKYWNKVNTYIEENNLSDKVLFYPNLPYKYFPVVYQLSSLFVLPSLFEGFGIPILEAISSGIPVISSKGSCFCETGGKHSIYVEPHNVKEISEAIQIVLTNNTLYQKMKTEGLKHAQNFKDKIIVEKLFKVYSNLFTQKT